MRLSIAEDIHLKPTLVSTSRLVFRQSYTFSIVLLSLAGMARAQVTSGPAPMLVTAGSIASSGGQAPTGTINVSGPNISLSGNEVGGSLALLDVTSTNQTVTFFPALGASLAGPFIAFTYNGATYNNLAISMTFTAAQVTVPNVAAAAIAQYGAYSAQVSNVPFTMTGTVSVLSGPYYYSPALFTVPIAGSGLYTASTTGTRTGGPGGIPGGEATYTFLPSSIFRTDTVTQGAWNGSYGADGYVIANGANSAPPYATVSFAGASTYTWAGQTSDPRALQNGAGATARIASTYNPANYGKNFSINLNLTDGLTHPVALYLLDWDTSSRAETITITNLTTNTVYDAETLANFHNGVYAVWNLQGNVNITVTNTGSPNPVVAGIFFGPGGNPSAAAAGPPSIATYLGLDSTTEGAWTGNYGAKGYLIANDPNSSAPSSALTTISGDSTYTWAGQTSDPRAPQTYAGASTGIASAFTQYAGSSFTINLNIVDGNYHRVSLYLLDWDSTTRNQTITIRDLSTNTLLDTETFSGFHNGQYATWNLYGNVVITVSGSGYSAPVVSGIFFDN